MDTLLLVNGRVWQGLNTPYPERGGALAVRSARLAAVGDTAELRSRFPGALELDLGGRLVVPGLIDGHNHSVRAGVSWTRELDLARCSSRAAALDLLSAAVAAAKPGQWIAAVGGWHPSQLGGWSPARDLLDQIAPENPVFLQALYEFGVANSAALALVPGVAESADADGRVYGMPAYNAFLAAMGPPSEEEQLAGLAAMYRDFAAAGITGVNDPGGFGMGPDKYETLRALWRSGGLRSRLRLWFSAVDAGQEAAQVAERVANGFRDAGDDMLRATGIGEVVHFGCHDFEGLDAGFSIGPDDLAELESISRVVAAAGLPMQMHGVLDSSITMILDVWERVDATVPVSGLRFALVHCDRVGPANLARMKRLGVGAIVDDRQAFRARASLAEWGEGSLAAVPPLGDMVSASVPFGAGTDATRASSYDPWRSLHWLITGTSCDGGSTRNPRHLLSREDALHAYTHANTWFTSEESVRGRLAPGYLADLAVLDRDYFTVSPGEILGTRSELTLVGGEVAYSAGSITDPA
jgi:predicted amidohydrolase YtcJ